MCGRFALSIEQDTIASHFGLRNHVVLTPRYNIAPTQMIPVIRTAGDLEFLTWGLRPKWLKEDQNPFINARIETVAEKPAFRNAFKQQRCLVISNGYYEWKQINNIKQPFYIRLPQNQLFAFAALWEGDTCALLTKNADLPILSKIHDRMPVLLTPEQYALWLDKSSPLDLLQQIMQSNNLPELQAFPVSTKVNNPKNDFAECVAPLN